MSHENDTRTIAPGDITQAVALLTRFPVRAQATRRARAAWAWPLAGLLVGLVGALVALVALWLGLGAAPVAGLALAAQILATGALHEDGLADCADGFWGGWDLAARLDIMKDSRIGTYGVLALVLGVLLRWSLLAGLFASGHVVAPLLVAGALSRVPMVTIMRALPPARTDGLSVATGRPTQDAAILAAVVAMVVALLLSGFAAIGAALFAALFSYVLAQTAKARIGGQTGDVLGASQQLAEIGALIGLAIWIGG